MFSVVIPTLDSADTLSKTLTSLLEQSYPAREIIVADGGSCDGTQDIARRFGAMVIQNPLIHAAGGRNQGATQAVGDWLAFTDSDCIPAKDWLEKAEGCIRRNPDLIGLGGAVIAAPPRNEIEAVAGNALLNGVLQFPSHCQRVMNRSLRGAFITANVFYRRDIFWDMNGFDVAFANYAEDIDFYWRIIEKFPGRLLFDPGLIVAHQFPYTFRKLFWKWHQYGLCSSYLQKHHGKKVNIDRSHYVRLMNSIIALAGKRAERKENIAQIVQLTGHLSGKMYGSCKLRIINL